MSDGPRRVCQFVAHGFDPRQPGARRLFELAQDLKRRDAPTSVQIVAPLLWADEGRAQRGDEVALPAELAGGLIADGLARPTA